MDLDKKIHELALAASDGVGSVLAKRLLEHFGSAEHVFSATKKELTKVEQITRKAVDSLLGKQGYKRAENEIGYIVDNEVRVYSILDADYPFRLRNLPDPPVLLFVRGNVELNQYRTVAIVGTRRATDYGRKLVNELVEGIQGLHTCIISGLALGVDGYAHQAALDCELPTIGVLGHGVDRIYPGQHRQLAKAMLENGGIISEFFSNTHPDRENFPRRNRIISGLSEAVIVIESKQHGGSMITADIANGYNRDVFAFPGRITDEYSEGCNYLIRTNRAYLITGAADLAAIMNWEIPNTAKKNITIQKPMFADLTEEEQKVINTIAAKGKVGIEELSVLLNIPVSQLAVTLLNLEIKGIAIAAPGKVYSKR